MSANWNLIWNHSHGQILFQQWIALKPSCSTPKGRWDPHLSNLTSKWFGHLEKCSFLDPKSQVEDKWLPNVARGRGWLWSTEMGVLHWIWSWRLNWKRYEKYFLHLPVRFLKFAQVHNLRRGPQHVLVQVAFAFLPETSDEVKLKISPVANQTLLQVNTRKIFIRQSICQGILAPRAQPQIHANILWHQKFSQLHVDDTQRPFGCKSLPEVELVGQVTCTRSENQRNNMPRATCLQKSKQNQSNQYRKKLCGCWRPLCLHIPFEQVRDFLFCKSNGKPLTRLKMMSTQHDYALGAFGVSPKDFLWQNRRAATWMQVRTVLQLQLQESQN